MTVSVALRNAAVHLYLNYTKSLRRVVDMLDRQFSKSSLHNWYLEAGLLQAQAKERAWDKDLIACAWKLVNQAAGTLRSCEVADVVSYIAACNSVSAEWWGSALQRKRGKLRFRTYCGRKRCLDNFYQGLVADVKRQPSAAGKQLVIAYGAATFSPSGNGKPATPTTAAFKACTRLRGQGAVVQKQNECRTSRQCCHCHGDVESCWQQCRLQLSVADHSSVSAAIQVQTCHGGRAPANGVRLRGLLFCVIVSSCAAAAWVVCHMQRYDLKDLMCLFFIWLGGQSGKGCSGLMRATCSFW
jgi:hypothetical protein